MKPAVVTVRHESYLYASKCTKEAINTVSDTNSLQDAGSPETPEPVSPSTTTSTDSASTDAAASDAKDSHGGHHKLGQLAATAICGNDITSSCLYVSALAIVYAGKVAAAVPFDGCGHPIPL